MYFGVAVVILWFIIYIIETIMNDIKDIKDSKSKLNDGWHTYTKYDKRTNTIKEYDMFTHKEVFLKDYHGDAILFDAEGNQIRNLTQEGLAKKNCGKTIRQMSNSWMYDCPFKGTKYYDTKNEKTYVEGIIRLGNCIGKHSIFDPAIKKYTNIQESIYYITINYKKKEEVIVSESIRRDGTKKLITLPEYERWNEKYEISYDEYVKYRKDLDQYEAICCANDTDEKKKILFNELVKKYNCSEYCYSFGLEIEKNDCIYTKYNVDIPAWFDVEAKQFIKMDMDKYKSYYLNSSFRSDKLIIENEEDIQKIINYANKVMNETGTYRSDLQLRDRYNYQYRWQKITD